MRVYLVVLKEFKDSKHNIIDIAKSRSLALLGVMEAASPVNGDVSVTAVELNSGAEGSSGRGLAELEEAIESRAIRIVELESVRIF